MSVGLSVLLMLCLFALGYLAGSLDWIGKHHKRTFDAGYDAGVAFMGGIRERVKAGMVAELNQTYQDGWEAGRAATLKGETT